MNKIVVIDGMGNLRSVAQALRAVAPEANVIVSSNPADIRKAVNYVRQGLDEALAGKAISAATTRPYGCSIKYK